MDLVMLERLGVVEIPGADVFGGDIISPPIIWLFKVAVPIVMTSVAANWADFKDGLFEGYNAATH